MSETSDHQLKKDDMCSDFARAVIVAAEPMLTDQLQEIQPSVASHASVNLVPKNIKEASFIFKEQTPVEQSPVLEEKMDASIRCEQLQPKTSEADKEKTEYEAVSCMDRALLIYHYEKKLGDFIAVPQNLQEIGSKTYSRSLIQIVRDFIRTFQTVPCPISEDVLKKLGIDRATMPSPANVSHDKSKYNTHGDNFNRPWLNNTSSNIRRPPYNARYNGKKSKQPHSNVPSILTRSNNAWLSNVVKNKYRLRVGTRRRVDAFSLEARIEKTQKFVRRILNKITPSTFLDLGKKMVKRKLWKDPETLPAVADIFIAKTIDFPYIKIYSDLCYCLHKVERNTEEEGFQRLFHGAIIRKCQRTFENIALSQNEESAGMLEKQIGEEQGKEEKDDKKIADLNEKKAKEKRQMIGTIRFMSHLLRMGLLNYKIIENCIVILIGNAEQSKSELMIEYAVELMKHVGPYTTHKKEDEDNINIYVSYLEKLFKHTVSNRVKFMIMDLMELRDKKWERKNDCPKTMDEVKMEFLKEEEQNRQDRENYEKAHELFGADCLENELN